MPNYEEDEAAMGMDVEGEEPSGMAMMVGAGGAREGENGMLEKETRQMLAELHEVYRALYRHLPPHLRPPGMTLLEAADALGPRRPNAPLPASSSSFLPPLVTLRWASRAMRFSLKALLERVDQATATATGNHVQLAREEMDELGVVDFTEQVWELMELCLLADGAGAAGWEVVAWAAPFWGPLPAPGRTPESAWHAAWEGVLRGELEHAAEILDAVGVSPDAGASYRGGAGAATAASMWFWPSHQVKDRVLSLLSACPLLRAMAVLREEAEARANGAGAASPDDDAYELRRREVGRALAREGERWRREVLRELADLPRDGCQGVRRLLEMLAGRDGAAERAVRALKAAGRGGAGEGEGPGVVRGWRLRFASKVLYEAPGLKGRELAEALVEAKEAGQAQEGGGGGGGGAGAEGLGTEHDIILGAVLTRDVGPLLQAINAFCQGDRQGHDVERLHLCTSLGALYHLLLLLDLAAQHAPALRGLRTPVLTARREEMLREFVQALMERGVWRPAIAYALGAVEREAGLALAGDTFAVLGPRLAYESKESREWLERIGNAPAGLVGGGTALLLRIPWIEASVAGGKEAWSVYAERGELTALQIAVTLWAKSDWGKKELRERIEEMCGDFLGALARLLDPLDDQRVGVNMSIHDMMATASAVVSGAAAETSGQGAASKDGGAVFDPSSMLVRVDVPELQVLYGIRQALARFVSQPGEGGAESGGDSSSSLTDALQALVCTLPPRGFAPRRLWPAIIQACMAMLQTALRDDEPKSEPGTAPLDSEQAAALMTCMAQVDVHPRRREFRGDTEWWQGRREALARTLGRAFADDHKFSVMYAEQQQLQQQSQSQQGQQQQHAERESAYDLLGPLLD